MHKLYRISFLTIKHWYMLSMNCILIKTYNLLDRALYQALGNV